MTQEEIIGLVGFFWILGFVFGCMFGAFSSNARWRGYANGLQEQLNDNAKRIEEIQRRSNHGLL